MLVRRSVALIAAGLLVVAACTGGPPASAPATTDRAAAATSTVGSAPATEPSGAGGTVEAPALTVAATIDAPAADTTATSIRSSARCAVPDTTTPVEVAAADATGHEWSVTSFDGTVIRTHWFPLTDLTDGATAPTVLMGPGWGSAGDTDVHSVGIPGVVTIATLRAAGFNVLTWDPRGFGQSSGTVEVDSPQFEGRDVQQLIDWVATQPQVELDATGDPRMGMFGASYGGGIQFVAAAIDCRVDAIVPVIAWHSLQTSLFKADTAKTGWANFLAAAASGRRLDPTIARTDAAGNGSGILDPPDVQWFADRGPGDLVNSISVPTLIIQGTVDTLFTLDEAATNFAALRAHDVPVSMLWFCGGHGACLTNPGDAARTSEAAIAWLRRWVMDDTSVDPGSTFEFVDQDGVSYTSDRFPVASADKLPTASSSGGELDLTADGGAGPAVIAGVGGLADTVAPITPGRATNAVEVTVSAPFADTVLVGAPELTIVYSGMTPDGPQPTRIFAQLVDDTTGLVLGNQITPIEVSLDGANHTVTLPLEMVAFTMHPGSTVTLQIVASTVTYAVPRLGGIVQFRNITITLPAVTGATAAPTAG